MTEWNASGYNRESTLQQTMAQEQLAMLTLVGNERILDVGCGDGKITAAIAERVPSGSVLGVDPSSDMVAFAANHFNSHANLQFAVADARKLPYRSEFDLVVSFNALHWVPEQGEALASIHAVLKPSGRAMLRLVPDGKRESLEDVIEEIRQQPRWSSYFASFTKPYLHLSADAYLALAEKTGFKVLRLDVLDKAWDFKTREGFVAFGRVTFVEWIKHIPEEVWNDFITEVLNRYRTVASENEADANTFKFYQMEVELTK